MTEKTSERDYLPGTGKSYLMPFYDVMHRLFRVGRVHQEMIAVADIQPGHRVLDVGCGTGNLLRATGKRHPGADLAGLDPDPRMLKRARRKTKARLDRGFAQELPYPDNSFDRVFSSLMLHHLDTASKDEMLAELRRVLRPGGVLVLADIKVDHDGHGHGHGAKQMSQHLHDNVGDAVAHRLEAAGFAPEPTRTMALRKSWQVGIEVAR